MKEGIFYKRDALSPLDVRELIKIWEADTCKAFSDYFRNWSLEDAFMDFLSLNYPKLHDYCYNQSIPPKYLEDVTRYCEEYYTDWIPNKNFGFFDEAYELSLYPLAHFLLENNEGWEGLVEFFTNPSNTAGNIPWIDCYNIRKDFENGRV